MEQIKFTVEETINFAQNDLIPEDIMILDARTIVYIWIGKLSLNDNRKLAFDVAQKYLQRGKSILEINFQMEYNPVGSFRSL